MRISTPGRPGTFRLTLSALVIAVVVLVVRRWEPTAWWWVGGSALLLVVVLGWWRGVYLTTNVRRRFALMLRNRRSRRGTARSHVDASATDVRTTVLLQIGSGPDGGLPLSTIAEFLDRYGIRCAGIRVMSCAPEPVTWIGLTLSAADNLTALLARSEQIPLYQTAHVVRRRLGDHLRELGWTVQLVDAEDIPWPAMIGERWHSALVDGGHLAAYQVRVDKSLPETLSRIWGYPVVWKWTVLEMTGDPARPAITAGCALLTADEPPARSPFDGLTPEAGNHSPALEALNPASTKPLGMKPHSAGALLHELRWAPVDELQTPSHIPQAAPSA